MSAQNNQASKGDHMKHLKVASKHAPSAIGTYSQAIKTNQQWVFVSGQIGFNQKDQRMLEGFEAQANQVFKNLKHVISASGASLFDVVKLTVYLKDLDNFNELNNIMAVHFQEPYPARAAVEVSRLPKDALIEIDAIVSF